MKRGPKPLLTDEQREKVGKFCERRWQEIVIRAGEKSIQLSEEDEAAYASAVAHNRLVLLKWSRFEFARSAASERVDGVLKRAGVSRHRSPTTKQPYAKKQVVLGEAAAWCWRNFRRRITSDYADECWDDFRELENDVRRYLASK